MEKRFKVYGSIFLTGIALIGTILGTREIQNGGFFERIRATNEYQLDLTKDNAFKSTGSGTQNIYTKKGYAVPFSYTNCTTLSGGHVKINEGGTIVNDNQIASVSSVLANFTGSTSSTEFQFRASFDKSTWGEWGSLASGKSHELPSEPYYFEFKAVNGDVNLTSLTLEYTCIEHEGLQPGGGGSGTKEFVKVTSALDDYAGTYLIVCDSERKAFDASLDTLDASGNVQSVTISDNKIEYSELLNGMTVEIESLDTNYSIKTASGYYIGNDSSTKNTLSSSKTSVYENSIDFATDSNNASYIEICGTGGKVLAFNKTSSNGNRFRYYTSIGGDMLPIQLYKLSDGSKPIEIPEYEAKLQITDNNENYIYGHSFNETFETENFSASVLMSNGTETAVDPNDLIIDIEKSGVHYTPNVALNSEGTYNVTISYGTLAPVKYEINVTKIAVSSVTFDKNSLRLKPAETYTLSATVLPETAFDKSLTWTSSNSSVATVSASGTIAALSDGTTTIKATANNGVNAECSVTVSSQAAHSGTSANDPFTVSEALEYFNQGGNETTGAVYITGVVTGSPTIKNGRGIFYITDGSKTLYCYNVQGLTNTNNVTESMVKEGNTLVVTGSIQDYKGTIELAYINGSVNCYIISYTEEVIPVTGISVSPTSADVSVNGTTQLTATISPGNASSKEVTWSSSNSAIASVDQNGLVTGHVAGQSATIYAKSVENNNIQATCTVNVKAIAVTSVSLNKTTADMFVGGSDLTLSATVLPANATNKGVTWSSNNTSVASVNETGVVKAIGEGQATITATTVDGNYQATCLVTVSAAPTNGEASIEKFETISGNIDDHISYQGLKGSGTSDAQVNSEELRIYQNGGYLLLTSDAETYITEVTIGSSMSTTVAYQTAELNRKTRALNENENYNLEANSTITFDDIATDEFKIICNGADKNHRLYVNYIDVKYAYNGGPGPSGDVEVTGVSVSPKSLKLTTGDTSTLSALVSPNNATNKAVTWSSDNTSVVTVSNTGKVTAVGVGNASVTATTQDGEFTDACNISVAAKVIAVTGVTLDNNTLTLNEGDDATLVATVAPSNATNKDVTWSSSNGTVATVNSSGKVTAVSAGTTTITVTTVDGEKTASCTVTVKSSQGTGGGTTPVSGSDTITCSTLNLGNYGNGNSGIYSWTQLMKSTDSSIQGNSSKSSVLYNTSALPGYITSIELSISYAAGSKATAILSFGTSSQPSDEDINLGANTSYSLSSTGKITISPTLTNATYFKLSWTNGASYYSSIKINYSGKPAEPVPVTGITMNKTSLNLGVGKTDTLSVSYTPNNATTGKGVTWSVINANPTGCVTVDSSGNVKAVSAGTAKVVATSTSNSQITATCNVTVEATPQAAWTIMMYVCGADLESESYLASGDFQEILKVTGQPDDVNIIIQTGGATKWSSTYGINASYNQRYHVENRRLVCDNSQVYSSYKSMGLSSTFADFVAWGLSEYPADKTGVILWNHGGAMRGVCYDEKSNDDSLLNSEVKSGMSSAFSKVGRSTSDKLEFIGYDACLMQAQDIAEFNSQYFNYMIASQESEAGYGWDYDNWVDDLYAKRSTETILTAIVDSFIADNGGASSRNGDQTLSWLNLAYMSGYKTAWENLASALNTKFGTKVKKNDFYTFMNENVKYFGGEAGDDEYFGMFDVIDFLNKISANSTYNPGDSYIDNVKTEFNKLVKYSVAQKGAGNANGLCCIYSKTSGNWLLGSNYSTSQTNFTNWRTFVSTYGQIS